MISTNLGPKYINLSASEDEVVELVKNFEYFHGIPQCLGAVGWTLIDIKQPLENRTDFINRKGRYSINVQAVCDYRQCFIDVVIKWTSGHVVTLYMMLESLKLLFEHISAF